MQLNKELYTLFIPNHYNILLSETTEYVNLLDSAGEEQQITSIWDSGPDNDEELNTFDKFSLIFQFIEK